MATTQDVLDAAEKTGKLLAEHPTTQKLEQVFQRLQANREAQQTLNSYEQHLSTLAQKQQQGQPIEPGEKQKLEQIQQELAANPLLGELQMAQMDYLDLTRKVREAIFGGGEEEESGQGGGGAPGGGPGLLTPGSMQ